jgi:hypothetical protein
LGFEYIHATAQSTFQGLINNQFVPVTATRFLQLEKGTLAKHLFYNDQWGWGGYLGYHLYPDYRIFQDGRYIFHPLLAEVAQAVQSPEDWDHMMDRRKIEVAILENIPRWLNTTRRYPDGSTREFRRPYYISYMPKSKWALIYWDEQSLIFVRRAAFQGKWLLNHEFKYALPYDYAARNDAINRKEIPLKTFQVEILLHALEINQLQKDLAKFDR